MTIEELYNLFIDFQNRFRRHRHDDIETDRLIFDASELTWKKYTLISFFESLDGFFAGHSGTGSATANLGGMTLNTGSTNNSEALIAVQPEGSHSLDFSKNPTFSIMAKLDQTTNQTAYLTVGEGASSTAKYFGFKISDSSLSAVNRNGSTETATNISGITLTNWNLYQAELVLGRVQFYVNGIAVAGHTTNIPTSTSSLINYFYIKCTAAASKVMYVTNMRFNQDI